VLGVAVVAEILILLADRRAAVLVVNTSRTRHACALDKCARRTPVLGLVCLRDFVVELVDLLEGQALGLVDEEVDKRDADEAKAEPDEEDLGLQVGIAGPEVDEVRCGVGNSPVEQPLLERELVSDCSGKAAKRAA